jgi:hypothetical protein
LQAWFAGMVAGNNAEDSYLVAGNNAEDSYLVMHH